MKNKRLKIVVLSDLKEGTESAVKNAISLSKIINADIEFFHVKKPTDVVERDNQLSAMRTIYTKHIALKKKINQILEPITECYNVKVKSSFTFGNVKNEIKDYIEASKPDIIVLGQRNYHPLHFIRDYITHFVLKQFNGIIVISPNNSTLSPDKKITLGVLNDANLILNTEVSKGLLSSTKTPLKYFKILDGEKENTRTSNASGEEIVEYLFEQNSNTLLTLSKYITKNNINLLCFDRIKNATKHTINTTEIPLKELVNKLNVSILVSSSH